MTAFERGGILLSSLASWSLAEAYIAKGTPGQVVFGFYSFLIAFCLCTFLFAKVSDLFQGTSRSFTEWAVALAPAFLALHLTLPAAILARTLGTGGTVAYEIVKLLILLEVLKRLSAAVRSVTGWPSWSASLLVLSPWMLAMAGLVLIFFVMTAAVMMGLAGALAS